MGFVPRGIIPPIITPLTDDGEVNYPVLRQMVNHLIDNGVHGLFPLGTTGEFYAFDDDTYRKILETVKDETRGRVPVYGGANHITTRGVIRLVKICEEVGVDAVSVLTPMFVSQTQDELYDYYAEIAASTTLPIILYNVPSRTGMQIAVSTLKKLSEIENIVAIKEASGNISYTAQVAAECPELDIYSGNDDEALCCLALGGKGLISVTSNVAPREKHDEMKLYLEGKHEEALEIQKKILPLDKAMFMDVNPIPVKEALNIMGFKAGECRLPLCSMTDEMKAKLKSVMENLGLVNKIK